MKTVSTRELAVYAADQLMTGSSATDIAKHVAAVLIATNRALELSKFNHSLEAELTRRGVTQVTITSALV